MGGLIFCYEGISITEGKVVNPANTQLNDALIASHAERNSRAILFVEIILSEEQKTAESVGRLGIEEKRDGRGDWI